MKPASPSCTVGLSSEPWAFVARIKLFVGLLNVALLLPVSPIPPKQMSRSEELPSVRLPLVMVVPVPELVT